jgi:hypothetical protein
VFLYVYFIGIYVAPLLMGVALWRSRSVPRWLAVLFFAGLEVAQQQISTGPVVILYSAALRGRDDPARGGDLAGGYAARQPATTELTSIPPQQ